MLLAAGVTVVVLAVLIAAYFGVGWWLTSGDGTHGWERGKESLKIPAFFGLMMIVVMWETYWHPNEYDEGWD